MKEMRSRFPAPVNMMGRNVVKRKEMVPRNEHFATLISLILSLQTKHDRRSRGQAPGLARRQAWPRGSDSCPGAGHRRYHQQSANAPMSGNTTRPTLPCPTIDSCSAQSLMNPQAATRNSHPDVFPAPSPDIRLLVQPLVTQTLTRSDDQVPYSKRLRSPPQHRGIRKSCPLYAGGSPCFASLARPSVLPMLPLWQYLRNVT